jgi:uncharacterized protein
MIGDPIFWLFVLPGLLLGAYAQSKIKLNIAKYSQVPISGGLTGAEVARRILDAAGLQAIAIEATPGMLSDHYDPRTKRLRLSQNVYFAPTVAAAGVAAHEAGHALQDAEGVILFGVSSLFSLITLPVEFNASSRALNRLVSHGIISDAEQIKGVKSVLSAAAWTYVAAAMSAIGSWLFYIVLMLGSRGRRTA